MTEDERELLILVAECLAQAYVFDKAAGRDVPLLGRDPRQSIEDFVERIRNPQYPGTDR
jgi:hypothetical protein